MGVQETAEKEAAQTATPERLRPPEAFVEQANITDKGLYESAAKDPEGYWADWAKQLTWQRPWQEVLDWKPPHAKWFMGGQINASENCIDRHLPERASEVALAWEGEPGDRRDITYGQLHEAVSRFAGVLRGLGVKKGDRVTLYMPMIVELPVAMLACARIGAPHSMVFAGFSPTALAQRMEDAESDVLVTCDGYYRRGKVIDQKKRADEAVAACGHVVKYVVTVQRFGKGAGASAMTATSAASNDAPAVPWTEGRDHWFHDLMETAEPVTQPEPMDAEDMLFMMYTSGTTGKPKGIVHTTGGYLTGAYATSRAVLDLKPGDSYWCMADIGWITGHSYIVYGPLMVGCKVVMYEGAPDTPDPARPWKIVEDHGVEVFYTAPTAIRSFIKAGESHPQKHDLSSLRLLGSVGEPINPKAWRWYHETIGGGACPIVDTWWQTETGSMMIAPLPAISQQMPGSAVRPLPGIEAAVVDDEMNPVPAGETGSLILTRPWPSMLRTLWREPERYVEQYWRGDNKDIYLAGDAARIDEDGYFWILGRNDDVMNVAGHRLGTAELESALVAHPDVAEAAVVAAPDDLKGEVPVAFVILTGKASPSDGLKTELIRHIDEAIGKIARPKRLLFVPDLPKTRSGKIMRRLLHDIVLERPLGNTLTLQNPEIPEKIAAMYKKEV